MKKYHELKAIRFVEDKMLILIDGRQYEFSIASFSQKLLKANEFERNNFLISSSGYGISWPVIDEDISIDGLLKHRLTKKLPVPSTVK